MRDHIPSAPFLGYLPTNLLQPRVFFHPEEGVSLVNDEAHVELSALQDAYHRLVNQPFQPRSQRGRTLAGCYQGTPAPTDLSLSSALTPVRSICSPKLAQSAASCSSPVAPEYQDLRALVQQIRDPRSASQWLPFVPQYGMPVGGTETLSGLKRRQHPASAIAP